ncbi:hypothetical protein AOQ71_12465 [Bradyrhizobium manausense]|uniref:Uncharacterized protein n=2 Tax=Bradyrhizobium manausense TaxID=989370 RepID=A0A0R3E3V9_9BRAD|nr:hypothetical protein AOQ71_12465 [Bradyrhizobium manausense]
MLDREMSNKLPDSILRYANMISSAQQFYNEAAACRAQAERCSNQADRDSWMRLAKEWAELALAAERGQIFRR